MNLSIAIALGISCILISTFFDESIAYIRSSLDNTTTGSDDDLTARDNINKITLAQNLDTFLKSIENNTGRNRVSATQLRQGLNNIRQFTAAATDEQRFTALMTTIDGTDNSIFIRIFDVITHRHISLNIDLSNILDYFIDKQRAYILLQNAHISDGKPRSILHHALRTFNLVGIQQIKNATPPHQRAQLLPYGQSIFCKFDTEIRAIAPEDITQPKGQVMQELQQYVPSAQERLHQQASHYYQAFSQQLEQATLTTQNTDTDTSTTPAFQNTVYSDSPPPYEEVADNSNDNAPSLEQSPH